MDTKLSDVEVTCKNSYEHSSCLWMTSRCWIPENWRPSMANQQIMMSVGVSRVETLLERSAV